MQKKNKKKYIKVVYEIKLVKGSRIEIDITGKFTSKKYFVKGVILFS